MKPHKQILQELNLAKLDPDLGIGLPLWLPRGVSLKRKLENHVRHHLVKHGYEEVDSPHIGNINMYKRSGHYPYYADSQYPPIKIEADIQSASPEEGYLLKPMNCPHHIEAYSASPRSYKELPIKFFEFGKVYRYEKAGSVNGLLRARAFIQDDGHLFIMESELGNALRNEIGIFKKILVPFEAVGIKDFSMKLSLRGDGQKYVGSDEAWVKAENYAREALSSEGIKFEEAKGEAAFYGPKIDFSARDAQGREWQLGSIQVDFNLPERFNLEYKNSKGEMERPVMIHRAALGSMERFIAILLESSQGKLPAWLHPNPVQILPIGEKQHAYAMKLQKEIQEESGLLGKNGGIEVKYEGSLGKRIAQAEMEGIPEIWVIGGREEENQSISRRKAGLSSSLPKAQAYSEIIGAMRSPK